MYKPLTLAAALVTLTACGEGEGQSAGTSASGEGAASPSEQGGSITVGESSWTIVPSTQCSVYPGAVVSIAGHAAEDESLEIVLDYGGPDQVRIGQGSETLWQARSDTMEVEIDGQTVSGSAEFTGSPGGGGESVNGSWEVRC